MRMPLWRSRKPPHTEAEEPPEAPSSLPEDDRSEAEEALDREKRKLLAAEMEQKKVGKKTGWLRIEREKNHFGPAIIELGRRARPE